jgi:hypothetical protein
MKGEKKEYEKTKKKRQVLRAVATGVPASGT